VQPQIIEPTSDAAIRNQNQITLPLQTDRRVRFNPKVQRKYIDREPESLMYIQVVGDSFGINDDFEDMQFLENLYWKRVQLRANRGTYTNRRRQKIEEAEIDIKVWRRQYFA
ncbi:1102_t:CDS:2, partial [Dentiscutata heterogama]